MNRREVVEILVQRDFAELMPADFGALVANWWTIFTDNPEYHQLSEATKKELDTCECPDDPQDPRYSPLAVAGLRHRFIGVTNAYIARRAGQVGLTGVTVEGAVEPLAACPCCRYKTIAERGDYDICRVCFWEDDGSNDDEQCSGPNHMTLGEARASFARCGACTESAKRFVLVDGTDRYPRDEPIA